MAFFVFFGINKESSMIKIGVDCHNLEQARAGVARTLMEELRGLCQMPFVKENIRFFLYFKSQSPSDPLFDDPIFIKRVLPRIVRPSSLIFYNILLPFYAWRDGVDFCYFPCYMLPLFYFGKSIVTLHDVAYEARPEFFPPYHRYSYHFLSSHAAKRATAIVTISDFSKREIIKYYKVPLQKITTIHLAPATIFKKSNDTAKSSVTKQKYGIDKDFIFFVGQIFVRRRIYESVLAFEKIAKELPDLQFLLIGRDLTYPPRLIDDLCEKVNVRLGRKAIIRRDRVLTDEDLAILYGAAKIFIYPSEYEGFGLPPIEALASGTPPLVARSGVSGEIFGEAAFYVENPNDIDEMAMKIKETISDESARAKVLQAADEQLKKFNWSEHCEKLLKLFKEII